MNKAKLIKRLQEEEGLVLKPYRCSQGYLTIGYGRNLEAKGISSSEACMMLANDLSEAIHNCERHILYFRALPDNVQEVLVDMCFNLGIWGLLQFKRMLKAISLQDYETAKKEMLDSKYAKQVPSRARRNAELLKNQYASSGLP